VERVWKKRDRRQPEKLAGKMRQGRAGSITAERLIPAVRSVQCDTIDNEQFTKSLS
jgi:hypothetical protein